MSLGSGEFYLEKKGIEECKPEFVSAVKTTKLPNKNDLNKNDCLSLMFKKSGDSQSRRANHPRGQRSRLLPLCRAHMCNLHSQGNFMVKVTARAPIVALVFQSVGRKKERRKASFTPFKDTAWKLRTQTSVNIHMVKSKAYSPTWPQDKLGAVVFILVS